MINAEVDQLFPEGMSLPAHLEGVFSLLPTGPATRASNLAAECGLLTFAGQQSARVHDEAHDAAVVSIAAHTDRIRKKPPSSGIHSSDTFSKTLHAAGRVTSKVRS